MGPFGDAWAASSSSPGRTRTYNPSVNSRMLCRLSYRGRLRMRLYGSRVRASSFGGDGAQGLSKFLNLVSDAFFLIEVFRLTLGPFTREKLEADPGLCDVCLRRQYLFTPSVSVGGDHVFGSLGYERANEV